MRRLHLYLGLLLVPWFLVYAISATFFNHGHFFGRFFQPDGPEWVVRFDRPYQRPVPQDADLRAIAADILDDVGLDRPFWVYRPNPRRLNIGAFTFLKATRLTYFIDEGRLLAEDKRFRLDHAFTGIHARGGFVQESLLSDAWAVVVDLVGVGVILWVATGVYMWWRDRRLRLWGGLALGGGAVCFAALLLAM
ncbi:MAG TPA: hypothetical protein VMZ31_19350 [Phycisphaerae bacterium]|nr:hypothetical protein [Phycisphaerae bacterium]